MMDSDGCTSAEVTDCPLEAAAQVLEGRWRLILIHCLLDGPKRFSDLQRNLPAISRRMLAFDLKKLEEGKVVMRTVYPKSPVRVEYELTASGLQLRPIINDLYLWGRHIIGEQTVPESLPPIPSPAE